MADNTLNPGDFLGPIAGKLAEISETVSTNQKILYATYQTLLGLKDLTIHDNTLKLQASHSNPLNKFGKKCFSQTDEDGITLEIIRRLGIEKGVFAEFGVGNGLENNTLILAALGWRGFWVGGEELGFAYKQSNKFLYIKDWITLDNIVHQTTIGVNYLGNQDIDLISLDLDGNDVYLVQKLLDNNFNPKVFIVEYNAKFPPPVNFKIKYDKDHQWRGDDYFGASLSAFANMFSEFGYKLICCNSHSGSNAFFVRAEFMNLFADVPTDIGAIYVGPRYHLYAQFGHRVSPKTVEAIFDAK